AAGLGKALNAATHEAPAARRARPAERRAREMDEGDAAHDPAGDPAQIAGLEGVAALDPDPDAEVALLAGPEVAGVVLHHARANGPRRELGEAIVHLRSGEPFLVSTVAAASTLLPFRAAAALLPMSSTAPSALLLLECKLALDGTPMLVRGDDALEACDVP